MPAASDDPFVEIGSFKIPSIENTFVGRASCVVDATMEEIAAYEMWSNGRTRMAYDAAFSHSLGRNVKVLSEHSQLVYDMFLHEGKPRDRLMKVAWQRHNDDYMEVLGSYTEHPQFPESSTYFTRVKTTINLKCERMPPKGDVPQTRVEYLVEDKLTGQPPNTLNVKTDDRLMHLSRLRSFFAKREQLQMWQFAKAKDMLEGIASRAPTAAEEGIVASGFSALTSFETTHANANSSSSFSYKTLNFSTYAKGGSGSWGKAEAEVRALPEEVSARERSER